MAAVDRPVLGMSNREAADILGVTEIQVARLVRGGLLHRPARGQHRALDRDEVEQLALERYGGRSTYWATTADVAELLGVTPTRVRQLVRRGRLPAVTHGGRWFFRRHQVEVIANGREARALNW